jgi:murein DD-endopeptidase MepM/ murein hydrolase activator NlpD
MQSTPTLTLIPIDVDLPAPTLTPYTVVYDTTTGPLGCPLRPDLGTVVMTQGYGVGTHAPAAIWGAVDLAVDMDGDGSADITGSSMVPLVSTMGGTVELLIDPTVGNVVRIVQGKWVVAYAHVAPFITEADGRIVSGSVHHGDQIAPGVLVGFSSNTGQSPSGTPMGPHLDYQIWQSEVNVDPTPRITC